MPKKKLGQRYADMVAGSLKAGQRSMHRALTSKAKRKRR